MPLAAPPTGTAAAVAVAGIIAVLYAAPPKRPDAPTPAAALNTLETLPSSIASIADKRPPPSAKASPPVKLVASFNPEPTAPKPSLIGLFIKLPNLSICLSKKFF